MLRLAGGIRIPAAEVVPLPYRLFIRPLDTLVLFFLTRCRTGQCAAVRIERDRAKGRFLPHGIQGAVPRFVIRGRALSLFVAVLFAVPLSVIPAAEKIPLIPRYRHLIERLTVGGGHGALRRRAAVAVKGDGVSIGGPHGIECQRLVCGIHIFKVVYLFAAVDCCPACLRVAAAGEQSAAQRQDRIIGLNICHGATRAVCTGEIGDRIAVGDGKL